MNQLDQFLNRVARELRSMPDWKREEELRELRSHLEQRVEDFETQGFKVEEAQTKAVEALGSAWALGTKLCDAWEGIPFSWWRIAASVCGITVIWLASAILIGLAMMILPGQAELSLFPEALPILTGVFALVPFACGLLFSHWLGRRGRLITLVYFAVMLLILRVNLSFDTRQPSQFSPQPPDFFVAYINAAWLPIFNVASAFGGSVFGHTARNRTRLRLATVSHHSFARRPVRLLFVPLNLPTWARALGALSVGSSLFGARVWLTTHPVTPSATLRKSLILDGGRQGFEAPQFLQLRELAPRTPAEVAGRERRVGFRVVARAKPYFAANQIAYLKRTMATEKPSTQETQQLARVQANHRVIWSSARLVQTPNGWQVDEKSFDRSKLWSWFYPN